MKRSLFHLTIAAVILCLCPQLTFAKTGYVSDMLLLTFREGPDNSYAVTKTLTSNTPVSILDEENGFYKVELQSREIGWVDKKFIVFKLPKSFIVDQLKQENKTLENEISGLNATVQTLKDEITSLEASLKSTLEEKMTVDTSLSQVLKKHTALVGQSKDIQAVIDENKRLQENNATLSKNLDMVKGNTSNLFKTDMIKWFLSGVGVLLLGWIIGQNISKKKHRLGSSLLD